MSIVVTVSGPGETLGGIVLAIKKALKDEGCVVEILDEFPTSRSLKEYRDVGYFKTFLDGDLQIKVDHQAWGG